MPSYRAAASLFSRALALIYLIAFASFGVQVQGLIGSAGILPVSAFLQAARSQMGGAAFHQVPSIFWILSTDGMLNAACWLGIGIALAACLLKPHGALQRIALGLLFVLYLSLVSTGQIFMGYQWDYLLLETSFLAIFLVPERTRIWLFQWLLFRLMFESGVVKLLSHDANWSQLTALSFHFETQPLPTPVAWYLTQAPATFLKGATVFVFAVELVLPFLIFGPRRCKQVAAGGIVLLQVLILLTGNYTFFNWLTIALCLFLLDDGVLSWMKFGALTRANRWVSVVLFLVIMSLSAAGLVEMFNGTVPLPLRRIVRKTAPFGIVNTYGLFAAMTTTRPEISLEGSNDGETWRAYNFRFKAGPITRRPPWVAPYQPRLDWQMWFAALGTNEQNPWFGQFVLKVLQGSPPVMRLMEESPFGAKPPRYVRAVVYQYHFTDVATRRKTGEWWRREPAGMYFPAVSLR